MINKDNNEKENIDKLAEDVVSALREAEQDTSATPDEVVEVTAAPDEEGATPASGGERAEQDAFSASNKAVADTKVVPDDEAGQNAAATPKVIVKDAAIAPNGEDSAVDSDGEASASAPDNNKEETAASSERGGGEDVSAMSESDDEDTTSAPDGETNGDKKKRRPLVKVLTGILCACLIAAVIVLGYAAYLAVKLGRVDTENIYKNIEMSSYLYDSNGEEIDRLYYTEDRESVAIGEVPDHTKNAFIAIEDKTFYKHHGLNLVRMFGAVLQKLTGHADEISGTSTITQQLARNAFLPESKSQRTLKRKFKEIVYALKIEADLSKDEILDAYLNTIYLGYGCYGIKSAAYTYFGKDVSKLTLAESAALAALPQAPDTYALLRDTKGEATKYLKKYDLYANDLSKDRRDQVLDLMVEQGYIEPEEAEKAKVKITKLLKPHFERKTSEFTYFTDFVTQEVENDLMEEYSMSAEEAEQLIHTGGLRIYSTLDQDIQRAILDEFSNDNNFPYAEEEPQAAMVVTEVDTGNILAMVGGRNTSGQKLFNRATNPRQPGSSIKPLSVYSAALQKSFDYAEKGEPFPFRDYGFDYNETELWGDYLTAGSRVNDNKMVFNDEVWPMNYGKSFSGYNTFRSALQRSINTCAVKIMLQVGADYSMEMLRKYGISTLQDDASTLPNDDNPAALSLGAMVYGATPLDMALAYATFPNGGVRNSGASYTTVTDAEGKTVLIKKKETTKVLDEGVAFIMTDVLKSVVSRGIAYNASIYGTQVGGKTGTTNDDYDYWFVGFTPNYSAALWMGTDHNKEMSWTSSSAALLWSRIMEQIPDITEGEYPPQPDDVVYVGGEYYTKGTEPY